MSLFIVCHAARICNPYSCEPIFQHIGLKTRFNARMCRQSDFFRILIFQGSVPWTKTTSFIPAKVEKSNNFKTIEFKQNMSAKPGTNLELPCSTRICLENRIQHHYWRYHDGIISDLQRNLIMSESVHFIKKLCSPFQIPSLETIYSAS